MLPNNCWGVFPLPLMSKSGGSPGTPGTEGKTRCAPPPCVLGVVGGLWAPVLSPQPPACGVTVTPGSLGRPWS